MIVDTHCHLYYDDLINNIPDILAKSEETGIDKIIVPAVDISTSNQIIELAGKFPMIYAAIGIHPCDIKENDIEILDKLIPLLKNKKVVAIGETGLDYYWDKTNAGKQKEFFKKQIELAFKYNIPVVIHSRGAVKDIISIIKSEYKEGLKIHMHCFSGEVSEAAELLEYENLYFSFCGNVTYKNFRDTEVVRFIPEDRLLFETDSPFLTPVPFRGKTNYPYHIVHSIKKISEIKQISESRLIHQARVNTTRIYDI
jgi:TatD DNase family protein